MYNADSQQGDRYLPQSIRDDGLPTPANSVERISAFILQTLQQASGNFAYDLVMKNVDVLEQSTVLLNGIDRWQRSPFVNNKAALGIRRLKPNQTWLSAQYAEIVVALARLRWLCASSHVRWSVTPHKHVFGVMGGEATRKLALLMGVVQKTLNLEQRFSFLAWLFIRC